MVFKGGEFLCIEKLLQFEDAATRFAKIEQTLDDLLIENPKLTTADINRIHRGTVSWNGISNVMNNHVGSKDANREYEVGHGMNVKNFLATRMRSYFPLSDDKPENANHSLER